MKHWTASVVATVLRLLALAINAQIIPDRRTAEDDKPDKRKPDNHVVSVHGRFCQMMLV